MSGSTLGCILYEMCTLTHPFDGSSLKLLILKILRGIYPPVPVKYGKSLRDAVAAGAYTRPLFSST